MTPESTSFLASELRFQDVGSAEIAYRKFGAGPALLLVHGWPLSGLTFRKILPKLAEHFTCIVPDSPGAGETRFKKDHDFSFTGQANAYAHFVEALALSNFSILAHDTGATISRQLALTVPARVEKLVLIDTEIPGHRPPFISLYQQLTKLPLAADSFQLLLRSSVFRESAMGFGGCFVDKRLLGGDFHAHFIEPMIQSRARMVSQIRYLQGIDWALVDGLKDRHREIKAPVQLIWGEADEIFPAARAEEMVPQFTDCRLIKIPGAALFPHEETPERVTHHALEFLRRSP
jgi:haloalkane dehalogenase